MTVCTYIHRGERTCVDTCVSGDAVIDVAAHQTFLLASTCAFSLSLSLTSFFLLSSLSRTRTGVSALPHASRNWSRECNRPNAHEQLLFWQRFLQCHRDENNSQDNYRRASFISRHCTPPSRVSLFRNLRFISATRPVSGCRRDARRFCTLAKIMTVV